MHFKWYIDIILAIVAFIAAIVDTLAGGGGLITLPALLLSGVNPLFALGTVKFQASVAEFSATMYFLIKSKINYTVLSWLFVYTVVCSSIGVISLKCVPIMILEKIVPFLLLFVLIYYISMLRRKNIRFNSALTVNHKKFLILGSIIGFYNGFFGPGTGSIWAIALMKAFKIDLQKATMYAKPLNFMGNLAALIVFLLNHDVIIQLAICMSIASFFGARVGGKIVIYKDIRILKITFLMMMIISVLATFIKYYL